MLVIDTYIFYEWFIYNNQKYREYFDYIDKHGAYTTQLVMMEFYHRVIHEYGKEEADKFYTIITSKILITELNEKRIKNAAIKRSESLKQKKKLSYADSLNIAVAEELNTKVLTGDKEMKGMKNVEFVSKA